MNGTVVQQGRFKSDGKKKQLAIRSDVDWMKVFNYENIETAANKGLEYYWQRGMATGKGIEYKGSGGTNTATIVTMETGGFTLLDTSAPIIGALDSTISGIADAAQPVVTVTSTAAFKTGNVARFSSVTDGTDYYTGFCGIDIEITVVDGTDLKPTYVFSDATALGGAPTGGGLRIIQNSTEFYPEFRYIIKMSKEASMIVTCSVTHGYKIGQKVTLKVPAEYGMVEADGLTGTITAISTANNTFTLDIDSLAFTTFAFPHKKAMTTPSIVVPVGMDTAKALSSGVDILTDAADNIAIIGMDLAAGDDSPGGASDDVIYWVAGKSFNVDNE